MWTPALSAGIIAFHPFKQSEFIFDDLDDSSHIRLQPDIVINNTTTSLAS